jgi:hypothetical protein
MEALVKKIAEHAQIDEAKAKLAAEAAIEFIKNRVASSIDTQIAAEVQKLAFTIKSEVHEAVTGEPAVTMMERLTGFTSTAKDKIGDIAEDAGEAISGFAKKVGSFFNFGGKKEEEKPAEKVEEKK